MPSLFESSRQASRAPQRRTSLLQQQQTPHNSSPRDIVFPHYTNFRRLEGAAASARVLTQIDAQLREWDIKYGYAPARGDLLVAEHNAGVTVLAPAIDIRNGEFAHKLHDVALAAQQEHTSTTSSAPHSEKSTHTREDGCESETQPVAPLASRPDKPHDSASQVRHTGSSARDVASAAEMNTDAPNDWNTERAALLQRVEQAERERDEALRRAATFEAMIRAALCARGNMNDCDISPKGSSTPGDPSNHTPVKKPDMAGTDSNKGDDGQSPQPYLPLPLGAPSSMKTRPTASFSRSPTSASTAYTGVTATTTTATFTALETISSMRPDDTCGSESSDTHTQAPQSSGAPKMTRSSPDETKECANRFMVRRAILGAAAGSREDPRVALPDHQHTDVRPPMPGRAPPMSSGTFANYGPYADLASRLTFLREGSLSAGTLPTPSLTDTLNDSRYRLLSEGT